ncbi:uncharacterized protein LOC105891792 [Clupea harengus]|uniref:Uncharacterized protein LOC105891792 n=1 Tax=Clupea harengus TaxID=7950 RepID=A0A6P8G945_CLUHA|nr:uncharacterized protein LOC105891792 [Clupea harengus]
MVCTPCANEEMIGVYCNLSSTAHVFPRAQVIPSKRRMTTRCRGICLVVVCLSGIRAAESLTCTVHLLENGSALYKISEPAEPNWEADWAIGGTNVANDEEFNRTLVVQNTGNSLLLKAYHPNTTYIADYSKWPVKVSCNGPASSSLSEAPHDANKQNRGTKLAGGVIALIVIALLVIALLVILSVVFCWKKKKGCFRKKEKEQGDPEVSEPLKDDGISIEMVCTV